ncbi:MAG: hypothetical protein J3Q66DRAFT_402595 [Benniella sp.]|nr:MAG: hypothetical protein J3Q66DRAFT_402595 [Benniella sp.]
MKFTAIAVTSAALVGSVVSAAATFDYSCTTPIRHYNVSDVLLDINWGVRNWQNYNVVPIGSEDVYQAPTLKFSCQVKNDSPSDIVQMNCRNALAWLWISVTGYGSQWKDNGFIPESCWVHWVQNGTALVKWQAGEGEVEPSD